MIVFKSPLRCLIIAALLTGAGVPVGASVINPRETPIVKVVQGNAESVVNISTERMLLLRENPAWGSYGNELDYFFGEFFGLRNQVRTHQYKLNSVGSGVIVDEGGLIVTNAHVVHMASNIFAILNDGTSVEGHVVYENLRDDLALIKIKPPKTLKAAKLADAGDIMIGETVVAIGNPLGLENSVSAGIISGKERNLLSSRGEVVIEDLIQTDAPINPGNSGGALLNLNGELIGINVAVVQYSQSIGFAVPVDRVRAAIEGHRNNEQLSVKHRKQSAPVAAEQGPAAPDRDETDPWEPSDELGRMRMEMDQIFQNLFSQQGPQGRTGIFNTDIFYSPQIDIEEDKEGYVIRLDVSGLNKDKLEIDVSQYAITISGESSKQTSQAGPQGTVESRSYGSFLKSIPLPKDADPSKIKTETKGETLIIRLPKL